MFFQKQKLNRALSMTAYVYSAKIHLIIFFYSKITGRCIKSRLVLKYVYIFNISSRNSFGKIYQIQNWISIKFNEFIFTTFLILFITFIAKVYIQHSMRSEVVNNFISGTLSLGMQRKTINQNCFKSTNVINYL